MSEGSERNRATAIRYVEEVYTLKNLDIVEEMFAHPSEMRNLRPRDGEPLDSYEDLRRYFRATMSRFEGLSITVDRVLADEETAMVRWEMSGRLTESFFGIPATGEPFETAGVTSFEFEDGVIVEIHDHVNLLEFMPEVAQNARQGVVREMRDGIVVIDDEERIVDCNPATTETFGRDRGALLGEPVAELLGEAASAPAPGEPIVITGPENRRYFEVEASPLTGPGGDRLGRALLLYEVTERRRHIQQLGVLNRVLRHNLRNDLTVVKGVLDGIDSEAVATPDLLAMARRKTDELLTTAETARHIRDTLGDAEVRRHDLAAVIDDLERRARETYPEATVEATVPESLVVSGTAVLPDALWELIENACEHAGASPTVEITARTDGETATVTIADDGPGLPAHERQVLESGDEGDLAHGSGLGLWLVYWVFEASGGNLSFSVADGTTVRATLPLSRSAE